MTRHEHWRAFGPEWFIAHQSALLWLLNAPILGRWFRWCLRIRSCDVGYRARIVGLWPHVYVIAGATENEVIADFRTHWKFSKRLYFAFRPIWWLMHTWDLMVDIWLPQLSFGFTTLTAYPDPDPETTTVDGTVRHITGGLDGVTWSDLVNAAGSTALSSDITSNAIGIGAGNVSNQWRYLYRSILLFNTAVMGGAMPTAASLSLYGYLGDFTLTGSDPAVQIVTSNPASNTALQASDFATLGATGLSDSPILYSAWQVGSYNAFALNAAGLTAINAAGITKFGTRDSVYDMTASAPPWSSLNVVYADYRAADYSGTSTDPKLEVTYSATNHIVRANRIRPAMFAPGIAR